MRYGELKRELAAGRLRRAYLLFGEEPYLMSEACSLIVRAFSARCSGAPDVWTAWASEACPDRLTEVLTTAGGLFGAGHRLVILRSLEEAAPEVTSALVRAMRGVPASVTLVITINGKPRPELVQAVRSIGTEEAGLVEFVEPPPGSLPAWLVEKARQGGIRLSREAASEMVTLVGTDITRLMSELPKLRDHAESAGRQGIAVDDVRELVTPVVEHSVFDLLDAVGGRNAAQAMGAVESLMASGEPAARIVFMLARHVRSVALSAGMAARGASAREIATRLAAPEFLVRRYLAQARSWTEASLGRAIVRLHKADLQIKTGMATGSHSERVILELLVNDLLSLR